MGKWAVGRPKVGESDISGEAVSGRLDRCEQKASYHEWCELVASNHEGVRLGASNH